MTVPAMTARGGYAIGWALSGGPLTSRVRAGCAAAIAEASGAQQAGHLGHLEGVRAAVRRRRAALLRKHVRAVTAAWNACAADLSPSGLAHRFRRDAYLTPGLPGPGGRQVRDVAASTALGWLYGIYQADGYDDLVAAITGAIRDGTAEGEADALALAAARQGRAGFSIAAAFTAARTRDGAGQQPGQLAAEVLAKIIAGAAADVGRRLAAMAGDGAGEDGMAGDAVPGDDQRAVRTWTDWAVWAGIGAGILALYQQAAGGLATLRTVQVTWEATAGACPACAANAAGSPYPADRVPAYPGHPSCHCSLETRETIPYSFLAPFLSRA